MQKLQRYHQAQSWFAKNPEIYRDGPAHSLRVIAPRIAEVMNVQRVGIWFLTKDQNKLIEEFTFHANGEETKGSELDPSMFPKYFSQIDADRVIAVQDTFADPVVSELVPNYMKPHNIRATVDASIFADGVFIGVICCELVGETRDWDLHDKVFVTACADLIGQLIAAEQQIKTIIASLPSPVAMLDKNFNYLAMSALWAEQWKNFVFNSGEKNPKEIFNKDWLADMEQALKGKTTSREEVLVEVSHGQEIWLRLVIQPWKTVNQMIGGVVIMAENITSRKEAEMRLSQASKLTALGEMAGGIAHEINNPLSIIKGYIDLLRRHSGRQSLSKDLLLQYIEKMDTTVGRISRIVNGMRRFSRDTSSDEKIKYSLRKIVEETLDVCLEKINNNGTAVDVHYLEDDAFIFCRPVEISQVILNLINNSYQATANFEHPWIRIRTEEVGDSYRVVISDCGEGIPLTVRRKLFQPFFTTKDVGVGTGLGLSISRGIVEGHLGKLYYKEDEPNTTFVIELPKMSTEDTQKVL